MLAEMDRREALAEAENLLRLLRTDRRAALERIRRGVGNLRAHVLFRRAELGRRVGAAGYVRVVAEGRMSIGEHVQFLRGMIPSEIICSRGAELVLGGYCGLNYGVVIDSRESIRIGRRCLFGSMSCLRDWDVKRHGPIVLEDDVWIAHGAVVEPGVRIGAGSVVSAGSVVTTDVPPDSLVVGSPAESFPLGSDDRHSRRDGT
jgi:acetyltransferase-like isoleucine patch superfamily enzyme